MISKAERRKTVAKWEPKPWKGHKGSASEEVWDGWGDGWGDDSNHVIDLREPKREPVKSEIEMAIEYLKLNPRIRGYLSKKERKDIIAEYRHQLSLHDNFQAALDSL
jgi:hypothetical protein